MCVCVSVCVCVHVCVHACAHLCTYNYMSVHSGGSVSVRFTLALIGFECI